MARWLPLVGPAPRGVPGRGAGPLLGIQARGTLFGELALDAGHHLDPLPGLGQFHLSLVPRLTFLGQPALALFQPLPQILETLLVGHRLLFGRGEGGLQAFYLRLRISQKLLVLRDLGLRLIEAILEGRSVILTTNKDFTSWGEFFRDDNVAVPIVDRLIHHSHVFMLGGESYRLKQKPGN